MVAMSVVTMHEMTKTGLKPDIICKDIPVLCTCLQMSWNQWFWNRACSVWMLLSVNRHAVKQQAHCGSPELWRGLQQSTSDTSQSQGLNNHAWTESKPRAEGPQRHELIPLQHEQPSTKSWQPKMQSKKKLTQENLMHHVSKAGCRCIRTEWSYPCLAEYNR